MMYLRQRKNVVLSDGFVPRQHGQTERVAPIHWRLRYDVGLQLQVAVRLGRRTGRGRQHVFRELDSGEAQGLREGLNVS